MSHTVFIADLHLDLSRPHLLRLFQDLMQSSHVRAAAELYILGDLVEAWLGDDDDGELPRAIAAAIQSVAAVGIPVYFMWGNRDFLLGDDFAQRAGMQLIKDDAVVRTIQNQPTLLMHGDTLCTDDVKYQAIRAQVRTPQWKQAMLAKSLQERRAFAAQSRAQSQQHTGDHADSAIMDVNQQSVEAAMREAGVQRLIHGHTHRPALHAFELDGAPAQRFVVGDWYRQGSMLTVTPEHAWLSTFTPTGVGSLEPIA